MLTPTKSVRAMQQVCWPAFSFMDRAHRFWPSRVRHFCAFSARIGFPQGGLMPSHHSRADWIISKCYSSLDSVDRGCHMLKWFRLASEPKDRTLDSKFRNSSAFPALCHLHSSLSLCLSCGVRNLQKMNMIYSLIKSSSYQSRGSEKGYKEPTSTQRHPLEFRHGTHYPSALLIGGCFTSTSIRTMP